jgi:hypothetical protein
LIYPEYTETYDEIGPAHIFELNIEGEGFRARQCFHEGIVDLAQYDSVFSQASVMESEKTLCRMAWMRLYYPEGLKEEYKYIYEEYIKNHAKKSGELLVKERNLPLLEYAGEHAYFNEQQIKECIQTAVRENWTEGVCRLLQCQKQWFTNKEKDEYSFEDF